MSIIDSITGFSIHSDYFSGKNVFNIFPSDNDRIAIIYGRNGTGKSTIARGFFELANDIKPRSIDVKLVANESKNIKQSPNKIFVFDEHYIDKNIKIKEDGLGSIVLLGEQVGIEEEINEKNNELEKCSKSLENAISDFGLYNNLRGYSSPEYWISKITKILRKNWADTAGKQIKGQLKSSAVNDEVIERIAQLRVSKSRANLVEEFEEKFKLYKSTSSDMELIKQEACKLIFNPQIEELSKKLLQATVSKPSLTSREQELLELFGINSLLTSKDFLQNNVNSKCPICLQEISKEYVDIIIEEIDNIISREFESFKEEISNLVIERIDSDSFSVFEAVDSNLYSQLIINIKKLNEQIEKHNNLINKKLNSPFVTIAYTGVSLKNQFENTNMIIEQIEKKRNKYNIAVSNRALLTKELLQLNDEIAHHEIKEYYKTYKICQSNKLKKEKEITGYKEKIDKLTQQLDKLNSTRENLSLAADTLNEELKYIFFSEKRIQLFVERNTKTYKLKVNGKNVSPCKISSGERNALALCYFFADIAKHMDVLALYSEEMFLVIDDPVSSFDFENRIGIMSFLKCKLKEIMTGCASTKAMVLSHDISMIMDFIKVSDDISKYCKKKSMPACFTAYKLYDKNIYDLKMNCYNEYTELLKNIFDYSVDDSKSDDISIGNQIRRVLEAFSTFSYKKGIDQLLTDTEILSSLPTTKAQRYYEDLMIRLVLNGESHTRDRAKFYPQSDFYAYLSPEEKKRTSKSVLCLMYFLNPTHILSHIPEAKEQLEKWQLDFIM